VIPQLRPGIDPAACATVTLASGGTLLILPATATPAEVLAGRASSYAVKAQAVRDNWAASELKRADLDGAGLGDLAAMAVAMSYDLAPQDVAGLLGDDPAGVVAVCLAAIGRTTTPASRLRSRALALAIAGLGTVPLTPADTAALADWAANHRSAPTGW
jgi:hypothetical protein